MTKALLLISLFMPCVTLLGCSAAPITGPAAFVAPPRPGVRLVSSDSKAVISSDATPALRVMSFNLRTPTIFDLINHWTFRRELLAESIRRFNPDLLGTQECVASQAEYLQAQLPEYEFVGVGRNDGDDSGEMCGVFFKTDRFEKLDEGHFWLSTTPHVPGSSSWGSWFDRMVTWVKLRSRRPGGQVMYFFNTHFDSNSKQARIESAQLLREKIGAIAGGSPAIVTGDFNAREGSPPYNILTAGAEWIDTFRAMHPETRRDGEGTRHGFSGEESGARIDWIVTTNGFRTLHAAINRTRAGNRFPSDHFPVTAVLQLTAPTVASTALAEDTQVQAQ